jgi:hypothetical protein
MWKSQRFIGVNNDKKNRIWRLYAYLLFFLIDWLIDLFFTYFLCPRTKIAWAYIVTIFVLPSSSVFVHYLSNGCTHSPRILHMDISWQNTGQLWIWSWSHDFLRSYAPWWNFQFPFIISPVVLHIWLIFDIWIRQRNAQVKFEFGHDWMIFGWVMPLSP